jgi:acid stress chaperone HdeB
MMRFTLVVIWLLFVLGGVSEVQAQVTIDVSKINCDQFSGFKVADPEKIAIWLSGYYNGKRGNTIIDLQKLQSVTKKLTYYCVMNPNVLVMDAVNNVIGTDR